MNNMIRCTWCNELLEDDKGPLHPYSTVSKDLDQKCFCLSDDECLEGMQLTYINNLGYVWTGDVPAPDRSLLSADKLVFNKRNICLVKNSSIGISFRIKRKAVFVPVYIYSITRTDTNEKLYQDLDQDQLNYYLQVLSIDKMLTKA